MAEQNYDNYPKPWTIIQCRDRYVMGTRIGLRALSKISEVPYPTIANASSTDKWTLQREKFRATVDDKTIDVVSAQIAGRTAEIFKEHYELEVAVFQGSRVAIDMVMLQMQSVIEKFKQMKDDPPIEDEDDRGSSKRAYEMQALTSSLKSAQETIEGAINGQRKALGLDYSDINYAISSVRRAGLEVVEKNEFELFKQYLIAQASTQNPEVSGTAAVEISTLEVVPSRESTDSPPIE